MDWRGTWTRGTTWTGGVLGLGEHSDKGGYSDWGDTLARKDNQIGGIIRLGGGGTLSMGATQTWGLLTSGEGGVLGLGETSQGRESNKSDLILHCNGGHVWGGEGVCVQLLPTVSRLLTHPPLHH